MFIDFLSNQKIKQSLSKCFFNFLCIIMTLAHKKKIVKRTGLENVDSVRFWLKNWKKYIYKYSSRLKKIVCCTVLRFKPKYTAR